jgi:single-strand DNA-binding protein
MSLATDESYKDQSGQVQKKTEWHRVVVWGKQAENVSQYLAKGRAALVEGRLQTRSYDDQQNIKRYVTEIRADRVVFMSSGQGQGGIPAPGDQDAPANAGGGGGDYNPVFPVDSGDMDEAPF